MSTTVKQDREFKDAVISDGLLEEAIYWIKSNLSPEEVFEDSVLTSWAQGMQIDSIFTEKELSEWAESNGYVKE